MPISCPIPKCNQCSNQGQRWGPPPDILHQLHVARSQARYSQTKKMVLTLVYAARKLRPYFMVNSIEVFTNQPLKQILANGVSGGMIKWSYELNEYDLHFLPRKSIKAQALADFVVETSPDHEKEEEWTMYVDGLAIGKKAGGGVILTNP
ncbi:UNVERIFIED_CONTAM: hypothetical protein Slati_2538300 [Sesamum latifolium]|uniref:Reverse transcriptase RNase H-like domain-containing protein n=1 Tax=Sesamum latifolium TaxID=2727402 RepID=A0AAW2WGL7_9LAMI